LKAIERTIPHNGNVDARPLCVNCGRPVEAEFCSHCGEKIVSEQDYSLSHVVKEGLGLLIDFDFKFVRTVALLIAKPGFLTTEYWAGRRIRYTNPLQLLLLVNIFYFFSSFVSSQLGYNIRVMFPVLSDITGDRVFSGWAISVVQAKIHASQIPLGQYYASFNSHLEQLAKSLVILLVPILAIFLRLFYWRTKKYFVEQLIPAAHLVSFYVLFWSLFMLVMGGATKIVGSTSVGSSFFQSSLFRLIHQAPALIIGIYIFLSLRQTFRQNIWLTGIKSVLFIVVVIQAITNIYDFILFWIAFYMA